MPATAGQGQRETAATRSEGSIDRPSAGVLPDAAPMRALKLTVRLSSRRVSAVLMWLSLRKPISGRGARHRVRQPLADGGYAASSSASTSCAPFAGILLEPSGAWGSSGSLGQRVASCCHVLPFRLGEFARPLLIARLRGVGATLRRSGASRRSGGAHLDGSPSACSGSSRCACSAKTPVDATPTSPATPRCWSLGSSPFASR